MPFQTRTTRSAGISALSTWRRATKSLTAKTTSATIKRRPAQGPFHRPPDALRDGARAGGVVMDDDVADAGEPRRGIAEGAGRLVGQVHGRDALPPDEGDGVANRPERLQRGVELDGDGGAAGQRPGRIDDLRIGDQGADAARGEPACDLGVETFDEVPRVPRVRGVIAHAEQRVLGRGGRQTMLVYTPNFGPFRASAAAPPHPSPGHDSVVRRVPDRRAAGDGGRARASRGGRARAAAGGGRRRSSADCCSASSWSSQSAR